MLVQRSGAGNQGRGTYPPNPEGLPSGVLEQGRYRARFARTEAELDAVLRLRYEIFNLELGEGLASSEATGRDEDAFDRSCHHLLVEDSHHGSIVGTYRMQTGPMAEAASGFYSAGEFDLSGLPDGLTGQAVEVGRACIARPHRNRMVLFLLWRGLARYMESNRLRYLFGCCSLTSQDPAEGLQTLRHLEREGKLHPEVTILPLPALACEVADRQSVSEEPVSLPILFRTYLRYGALVCGPPALDREFKTIDFFVLFDIEAMSPKKRALFFGE